MYTVIFNRFTRLCNHHHYLTTKHFHHPPNPRHKNPNRNKNKQPCTVSSQSFPVPAPSLQPGGTANLPSASQFPLLGIAYEENDAVCRLPCLAFFCWHKLSGSIHVVARISASFLSKADQYPFVWTHHVLFICSFAGRLGCFPFVAIMHNAAMNISVQVFLRKRRFSILSFVKSGIARSHSRSMFILLRNSQVVFQSGCAILRSDQQRVRVLVSSYPPQH